MTGRSGGAPLDGIVFDLDDTLIDTARLLLAPADRRAIAAMRALGLVLDETAALDHVRALRRAGRVHVFRDLAADAGAPEAAADAGERAFFVYEVPELTLDADVAVALDRLAARAPLALLSLGDPVTQRRKVERLGIAGRFVECVYVARDEPGGKEAALRALLARRGWRADHVIVAGDRPDSDVRAGNRCGCLTVLVRAAGGEFAEVAPVGPDDVPWRTVSHVSEIAALLDSARPL